MERERCFDSGHLRKCSGIGNLRRGGRYKYEYNLEYGKFLEEVRNGEERIREENACFDKTEIGDKVNGSNGNMEDDDVLNDDKCGQTENRGQNMHVEESSVKSGAHSSESVGDGGWMLRSKEHELS